MRKVKPETDAELEAARRMLSAAWKAFHAARRKYKRDLGSPFYTKTPVQCPCVVCYAGSECKAARARRLKTARNKRWLARKSPEQREAIALRKTESDRLRRERKRSVGKITPAA